MNYRTECLEIKNIGDKSEGTNVRLIDANALADRIWNEAECYEGTDGFVWVRRGEIGLLLDEAPVVDAVKVVRCKDCLYSTERYGHIGCIHGVSYRNTWNKPDFFCSYGERKEGADNDCVYQAGGCHRHRS